MSGTIRVLVADDHAVVREGISHVLSATPDIEVVADTGDPAEVVPLAIEHRPDVVVLDISMPGESGLRVAARLSADAPSARVLILSMHDHTEYVLEAVRAGAQGYVLKNAGPAELREAIRSVHRGDGFFSPAVAGRLGAGLRGEVEGDDRRAAVHRLTEREREVLRLIAAGRTNKQIAAELGISPRTVETHRQSLMRKLQLHTVAELTRLALESGLLAG